MTSVVLAFSYLMGALDTADLVVGLGSVIEVSPAADLAGVAVGLLGFWGALSAVRTFPATTSKSFAVGALDVSGERVRPGPGRLRASLLFERYDLPPRRGPPLGSGSSWSVYAGGRCPRPRRSS